MLTHEIFDGGAEETFSIQDITEGYRSDPSRFFQQADEAELPVIEYAESITDPREREQNELSTAEAMLWYLTGVDMGEGGYNSPSQFIRIGNMTDPAFDISPAGKLWHNIMDFDFMWALVRGSEDEGTNSTAHEELLMEVMRQMEGVDRTSEDGSTNSGSPNLLGTLTVGEPWNEYQQLMLMNKDTWGPSIDYRRIVGDVRITNKKRIQKPYRHMSFQNAQMTRTAETVRHMIAQVGLSKEDFGLSGHGIQFRASYDYVSNPDLNVRDFRFEVERVGIAMRIVLFNEITDFILTNASVHATGDTMYGDLTGINPEKWLQWRKLWNRYQLTTFLSDPISCTKWELMMLGNTGNTNVIGVTQLINMLNTARNSRQLNRGTRVPDYGWVDNVNSQELYNKFTDSSDTGLNNSGGFSYGLFFNRPTASRLWFRRQSRQDESGRDTQTREVYRDLHVEWGKDRPETPQTGSSNIIRTQIS